MQHESWLQSTSGLMMENQLCLVILVTAVLLKEKGVAGGKWHSPVLL